MPATADQEAILQSEKLAVLATVRRDGSPQLSPINYAYQDGKILVSTTRNRAKFHNVRRNSQVSLCVVSAKGRPYVTISGRAMVEEEDIAERTAAIFRRMSDRAPPDNFEEILRQQSRILIVITPERLVP